MRRVRKKLGEMLVEAYLLTAEQLDDLLTRQKNSGMKFGDFLIDQGVVTNEVIIELLCDQLQINRYTPEEYEVGPEMAGIIPHDIATKHQIVPLKRDPFVLRIAMVDPLDINALDMVERMADIEVEPLICTESELSLLMNGIYGVRSAVTEVLGDLKEPEFETITQAEQLGNIQDIADAAPVVRLVNSILRQAVQEKASDIHISPQQRSAQLRLRIDGKLHEMPPPPQNLFTGIISRIKILAGMDIANTRIPQDGRFNIRVDKQEINLRASTLPTIHGENMVLRLLYVSAGALPLNKLGLRHDDIEKLKKMATQPYGMLLSVGPTGSGKSSSLYAILNEISNPEINIITLEDPVEFRMDNVRQVQLNEKAGMTFASGLRSILRQDPNVIMVGEIRDEETAKIATQAALTGHLVLSTLHTNYSAGAITRLQDMGIAPYLVASSLLGVCAQRLLRRICPHCAEAVTPKPELVSFWGLEDYPDPKFQVGTGCALCMGTGYKGRVGIFEILTVDEEVQEMIIRRTSSAEIAATKHRQGELRMLKDAAALRIAEGLTTFAEATQSVLT
ncbi:MAG: GspE/PulE family protein [Desulfobulbaceae bacterium]|nr:GspE/PulE family protein [Desulfobulbaceae bacterium]